jgi:hypothetical protein
MLFNVHLFFNLISIKVTLMDIKYYYYNDDPKPEYEP